MRWKLAGSKLGVSWKLAGAIVVLFGCLSETTTLLEAKLEVIFGLLEVRGLCWRLCWRLGCVCVCVFEVMFEVCVGG